MTNKAPSKIQLDCIRGMMRIACPYCRKTTRSYLGSGWTLTWCPKCQKFFRTGNEALTAELIGRYRTNVEEEYAVE